MPILHRQYVAADVRPGAVQPMSVAPSAALWQQGPWLQASIGLFQPMAEAMLQGGATLPTPACGVALLDTGASDTCIDEHMAQELGLPVVDVVSIATPSHASAAARVYPVTIEIIGCELPINAPRAIGAELQALGLVALIGRDVLQFCTLFYNGVAGQITLSVT